VTIGIASDSGWRLAVNPLPFAAILGTRSET
jgi:hypothetical protein